MTLTQETASCASKAGVWNLWTSRCGWKWEYSLRMKKRHGKESRTTHFHTLFLNVITITVSKALSPSLGKIARVLFCFCFVFPQSIPSSGFGAQNVFCLQSLAVCIQNLVLSQKYFVCEKHRGFFCRKKSICVADCETRSWSFCLFIEVKNLAVLNHFFKKRILIVKIETLPPT